MVELFGKAAVANFDLMLTPTIATGLFVLAVVAGHQYRRVWKSSGPTWQLWIFGLVAAGCLTIVGFLPMQIT